MEQPIMSKNKIAMTIFEKIALIDNTVTQMANLNAEAEDFQKKADEAREKETKIKNDNKIILLVTGICLLFSALFFDYSISNFYPRTLLTNALERVTIRQP